MILELILLIGLSAGLLFLVLGPLLRGRVDPELPDPVPLEETRPGQALLAIKDLDFDYATGKIADEDYGELRRRLTRDALQALKTEPVAAASDSTGLVTTCPNCGGLLEEGSRFCSDCGYSLLSSGTCRECAAPLPVGARYCEQCGSPGP